MTPTIAIDERDLEETFVRAGGPGGQNVNKVATVAELRFNPAGVAPLPPDVHERLARLAGRRMTQEGVLVIRASEFRTQERNRQAAIVRLIELIRQAAIKPKPRRKTRPSAASRQRRLDAKRRRSQIKGIRRASPND